MIGTVEWFRNRWASRFTDTVTVTDLTDRGAWNPVTKQYDTPTTAVVYTGEGLVRPASAGTVTGRGLAGEVLFSHTVYVPYDAGPFLPGYQVTVDTSTDPDLTGLTLTVQTVEHDTYVTRRPLRCHLSEGTGDRG